MRGNWVESSSGFPKYDEVNFGRSMRHRLLRILLIPLVESFFQLKTVVFGQKKISCDWNSNFLKSYGCSSTTSTKSCKTQPMNINMTRDEGIWNITINLRTKLAFLEFHFHRIPRFLTKIPSQPWGPQVNNKPRKAYEYPKKKIHENFLRTSSVSI